MYLLKLKIKQIQKCFRKMKLKIKNLIQKHFANKICNFNFDTPLLKLKIVAAKIENTRNL